MNWRSVFLASWDGGGLRIQFAHESTASKPNCKVAKMREILLMKKAAFVLLALGFAGAVANVAPTSNHRYVATDGNDSNDCRSLVNACRSVYGALEKLSGGSSLPPTAGHGTVYVYSGNAPTDCALWNPYSSPAIGLGFMGSNDANYSNPPNGWMHLNSAGGSSISIIGMTADTQTSLATSGGKSCVTVLGKSPTRMVAINGSGITFQNLAIGVDAQPVTMGFDSSGNNNGGAAGIHFINDAIATSIDGLSGPTVKEGQNVFQIYWDNDTLSTDCSQTPGSDAGANILINAGGPPNTSTFANVITNNWWYCGGGVKYYAPGLFYTIRVRGLDIEAYGRNVNPGIWFVSPGVPCLDCEIEGVELQDYFGSNVVPAVRNDSGSSNITVRGVRGYAPGTAPPGGYANINTEGPMNVIASDDQIYLDKISPLQKGQSGFFSGHDIGFRDDTARMFAPTAVRFPNLAITNMAAVPNSGNTEFTLGIPAPDGTNGAAQFASKSGAQFAYFYPQWRMTLAVGDFLIGKVWERSQTANGAPGILIVNAGRSACSTVGPAVNGDGQGDWAYVICRVISAPSNPYWVGFYGQYDTTHTMQFYAPLFNHIPATAISANEAYAYASAVTPYDHDCAVGTVCGLHASLVAPGMLPGSFAVSGLPSASSHPGLVAHVTDSTSIVTEGQSCTGGGSNHALAFSTGSKWKCF